MKLRAIALVAALFSGSAMAAEPVGNTVVALGMTAGQLTALGVTVLVAGGDHLHHVLIDAGMSPRHATYLIAALALLIACLGLVLEYRAVHEGLMLALFLVFLVGNTLVLRSAEKAKLHLRARFFSRDE